MKKKVFGALLAVTPFLGFSQPVDWERMLYVNPDGTWYAIPQSLNKTSSGTYTMWTAKDLDQRYVDPEDSNARSFQILFEIDCYGNAVRILRAVHWSGNNATGRSRIVSGPPGPWEGAPRGSNNPLGKTLEVACRGK